MDKNQFELVYLVRGRPGRDLGRAEARRRPQGRWADDMIKPAEKLVRDELRAKNPAPATQPAKN